MSNHTKLLLFLLVIAPGCRDHPDSGGERGGMLPREKITQIADGHARELGSFEGGEMRVRFDDGNTEWLGILSKLEQDDPEAAQAYHWALDKKDYQAVCVWHDPPFMGGTYWIFVDTKTGEVVMSATGL